jgi:uncharacterized protein
VLRPFTLLVKPASADCNLRCEYCFYLDHCGFYPEEKRHRMSAEVLERMIASYMRTPQPQYAFGWQGGEPTLLGLEFFQAATRLQQQYGRSGQTVGNGLQTNATLINDEMAAHFKKFSFLLGVSLDGPPEVHDHYRKDALGGGTHADVMRGIGCLQRQQVDFNILTLVSQSNVRRPAEVYSYLCDQGFLFHQYIPCVEPAPDRSLLPFSIRGPEWGEFLCGLFDTWFAADTRRVSVRLFDSILSLLVDGVRNVCHFGANCCQYFVVEYNGDVFPCDFFVEKQLCLGNVCRDSWELMQQSPIYLDFGRRKSEMHAKCAACRFVGICQGDCLKHRLCAGAGDPRRLSELCRGWEMFYEHTFEKFRELALMIVEERRRQRPPMQPPGGTPPAGAPGRNDPCPCGSGRKFKKCCGQDAAGRGNPG